MFDVDSINIIIKILLTIFMCILIPIYWKNYGAENFLWLSDVSLFLTIAAIWLKSPLFISMAVIGMLPFELLWNIDFFVDALTGKSLVGLAHYMFESKYSLFLRFLSLFHVFVPILWLWYLFHWGYDERAIMYMPPLYWIIIISSYLFTNPNSNVNWVFAPKIYRWKISQYTWLFILLIGYPLLLMLPFHAILTSFS